jgi:hypothetical protein
LAVVLLTTAPSSSNATSKATSNEKWCKKIGFRWVYKFLAADNDVGLVERRNARFEYVLLCSFYYSSHVQTAASSLAHVSFLFFYCSHEALPSSPELPSLSLIDIINNYP